jgi:hypothetical protein
MSFSLPSVGDVQGQVQAGNNLIDQIQAGDTSELASAGIALVSAVGATGPLAVVGGVLSGALSGLIAAGPMGAAIGGVMGAVAGFESMFGGYKGITKIYGMSHATEIITARVSAMGSSRTATKTGNPQGWAMADYCATVSPPNTGSQTKLKNLFTQLENSCQTVAEWASAALSGQSGAGTPINSPLCTPVWFNWFNQANIADCSHDLTFGSGGAGGTGPQLQSNWVQTTFAIPGLSQAQIVQNAIARAPDPIYWSSALYGAYLDPTIGSAGTLLWNVDLLNAMATVLMMLSTGCSTQSIVSELLIQSAIIDQYGTTAPTVGCDSSTDGVCPSASYAPMFQAGFYSLLDDYIALANAENAAAGISSGPSTEDKIGMLLLGATGACVVGLLGYSAVTRTSPLVVLGRVKGRLRRIHL